ncbi:MAG: YbaN family protein [Planctomycetes bacterium]|nr:YbaN family protein [Planctomycetota bacterium]
MKPAGKSTTEDVAGGRPGPRWSPLGLLQTGLGFVFLLLAVLGSFLPVLPTTPFVLVAAGLFARGSPRFHRRLLASRVFGSTLRAWQEHGTIAPRTKALALVMLWTAILASVIFALRSPLLDLLLIATAIAVSWFILSRPSRPRSAASGRDSGVGEAERA